MAQVTLCLYLTLVAILGGGPRPTTTAPADSSQQQQQWRDAEQQFKEAERQMQRAQEQLQSAQQNAQREMKERFHEAEQRMHEAQQRMREAKLKQLQLQQDAVDESREKTNRGCNERESYGAQTESYISVAGEGLAAVTVENVNGGIEVRCNPDAKDVNLHVTKTARGATQEEANARVAAIQIETRRDAKQPDVLHIEAVYPREPNGRGDRGANFVITCPPKLKLNLHTSNGGITVTGSKSGVTAVTANGGLEFSKVHGKLEGRTSNGGVSVRNTGGEVSVTTANGGIKLEDLQADRLKAVVANGKIKAIDIQAGGPVTLGSSLGDIDASFISTTGTPDVKLSTSQGSIRLRLPETTKTRLSADTTVGKINAEFGAAQATDVERKKTHLQATLNGGGGKIQTNTSFGSIDISVAPTGRSAEPNSNQPN